MTTLGASAKKTLYLLMSLAIALLLGTLLMYVTGHNPALAYRMILRGSFGSRNAVLNSLTQATPIILTGLAFVVALKSGIVNIGAEGQLFAGAMAAALVGHYVQGLPAFIHIPLAILAACVAGGLCGSLIAFLKVRFGAHAVITAIMLNHIIINFMSYLVNFPLMAYGAVMGQTEMIQDTARLPLLTGRLSIGIVIAVIVPITMWFMFRYTQTGFEMQVTGKNLDAANTAGIRSGRRMIQALFISGAIAGLAGAIEILGSLHTFIDRFSPGYGFDGIAVAFLSGVSFIGVIFSGIFFGALTAGSFEMSIFARIPFDFAMVIQAMVIMLVAAPRLAEYIFSRFGWGKDFIAGKFAAKAALKPASEATTKSASETAIESIPEATSEIAIDFTSEATTESTTESTGKEA